VLALHQIQWLDQNLPGFRLRRRSTRAPRAQSTIARSGIAPEVIHIICDRITDHDDMLRSIGSVEFNVAPGRGDGATNGAAQIRATRAFRVAVPSQHPISRTGI
jgi:hypothetical protein